jgi:hypothetical protein
MGFLEQKLSINDQQMNAGKTSKKEHTLPRDQFQAVAEAH